MTLICLSIFVIQISKCIYGVENVYFLSCCECATVIALIILAGFFACPMHTIFVKRSDSDSRVKAMKEIQRRARDTGHWPTTLIFPEGPASLHFVVICDFTTMCIYNFL